MVQSYKQRVANLKKGRETQKRKRERKLNEIKEEKEKLGKMKLLDRLNYINDKELKEFAKENRKLEKLVGTHDPLEKFKTSSKNNIFVRASNAKRTMIIDVSPDTYYKDTHYTRKYIKNFGSNLSNYLNDVGIKGKIQLETNFTNKGHLYKSGMQVELGDDPDLFEENELSYIVKKEEKSLIKNFDNFKGMRYFVTVDSVKDVESKIKNYK